MRVEVECLSSSGSTPLGIPGIHVSLGDGNRPDWNPQASLGVGTSTLETLSAYDIGAEALRGLEVGSGMLMLSEMPLVVIAMRLLCDCCVIAV